jgi:nucleoside triphosphatase
MGEKRSPDLIVGAMMMNPRKEVLLWRSQKWRGALVLPGGRVERGETAEEALRRKMYEDTGLPIFDIAFIGFQESIDSPQYFKPRHMLLLNFFCRVNSEFSPSAKDGREFVWTTIERAMELELGVFTRGALERYLSQSALA